VAFVQSIAADLSLISSFENSFLFFLPSFRSLLFFAAPSLPFLDLEGLFKTLCWKITSANIETIPAATSVMTGKDSKSLSD
jgi:hypothetical protein